MFRVMPSSLYSRESARGGHWTWKCFGSHLRYGCYGDQEIPRPVET